MKSLCPFLRPLALLAASIGVLPAVLLGALPVFINGGFELPDAPSDPVFGFQTIGAGSPALSGWTVNGAGVDVVDNAYWQAAEGSQSIDLNALNAGAIEQKLLFTDPASVYLEFAFSKSPATPSATMGVWVKPEGGSFTGLGLFTFAEANTHTTMKWQTSGTHGFTAGPGFYTFAFASFGGGIYGPALDSIRVVSGHSPYSPPDPGAYPFVPEPVVTPGVTAVGLVFLALLRRRLLH
jgi:hypothetical protein